MDNIITALKFIADNGSMFYDIDDNKFKCLYVLDFSSMIEFCGIGDTPEEAAKNFVENEIPKILPNIMD